MATAITFSSPFIATGTRAGSDPTAIAGSCRSPIASGARGAASSCRVLDGPGSTASSATVVFMAGLAGARPIIIAAAIGPCTYGGRSFGLATSSRASGWSTVSPIAKPISEGSDAVIAGRIPCTTSTGAVTAATTTCPTRMATGTCGITAGSTAAVSARGRSRSSARFGWLV